ncbi:hypothetical protein ABCY62_08045 [Acetivibrio clariflavus]|uniref:hypothetical protein n=1 Tax=Acetivibrio clariflavus TaxID=288965 RepID=UPI0031F544C9
MKRYITIKGDIIFKEYNSESWELIIAIYPEDVVPFYMELQLLASELSESFTVSSLNSSLGAIITFKGDGEESRIKLVVFCNNYFLSYEKIFPQAPVRNFYVNLV